jgi:EAL domain-containing protein (putative c-di-GMP-specific phosphodiesterase class I)/GGDEF domain-containing protein
LPATRPARTASTRAPTAPAIVHAPLKAAERRLVERYDHVTAIPNRLRFLADFKKLRGRTGRGRMLVLVTLAEAKHYNEILRALGHAFADGFVRAGLVRLRDIVPPEMPLYHVSVLSFAFVVPHDGDGPPDLAREIARDFGGELDVEDIPIRTKIGIGLMPLDAPTIDPAEVLRASLVAAQDSRRSDDGVAFYNNRSDAAHIRAFRILADLPGALAEAGQLSLAYQPRVDLATGRCHGAEALIRWRHPDLGNIGPGEFIPLAEQTALIQPLTDWVLDHALATARSMGERGHRLTMSVNASPLNLSEPGFDDKLFWACDRHGLEPGNVEIEFTEGTIAANQERATRQLERIRKAGVRIAIDDFGTGFSNLSYLRSIPADVLKIDQSFIRPLTGSDDFLVRQILAMAHGLGLEVCAEGIETAESYALLRTLGCDEGQGYHIARPMPQADFVQWLDGAYARAM